jgi:branched-chain amino acid transport system permease protein
MDYINAIIILAGINIIAVLGVAILTGYTGMFTIGHAGFMALGGYTSAILVKEYAVPFPIALLAGGVVAGLSSFIIGYPAFRSRLRGDYFAIATFGFAEAIRLLLNNAFCLPPNIAQALGLPEKTCLFLMFDINLGGAFGYMNIPSSTNVLVVIVSVALALWFAHMFVTSQYGKNCIAIGQDEVAAEMMGVNLLKTKLTALFISAFYAGVAGGLLGFYFAYQSPSFFTITRSSDLLAAVVFGGIQSLIGPVITGFILVAVPEILRSFAEWRLVIYGFLFVVVMVFRPQGLLGYVDLATFGRMGWRYTSRLFGRLSARRRI